jgi:WD40 repeat protein
MRTVPQFRYVAVIFVIIFGSIFLPISGSAQQTYTFNIQPDPADALVRIMNIKQRYTAGIKLETGEYDVEVSKDGYFAYREIITLSKDTILPVTLMALTPENIQERERAARAHGTPFYRFPHNVRDVNRLQISASGRYALLAGYKVVRLWDFRSGTALRSLSGHSGTVECAAFSPDERFIVSGGYDNTIRLWDVATGQQIRFIGQHDSYVESVAFSPDGNYLATGGMDNLIKLWDVQTWELITTFEGHTDWVLSLRFSPDSRYLISGSQDLSIKLWEISSWGLLASFYGFERSVEGAGELIDFSPDGKSIIGVSARNTFAQWDVATGEQIRTFAGHTDTVTSVRFSPDGRYIVSSGADRLVKVWSVDGREMASYSGHQAADICSWVNSVDISPDSRYIVSGGCDAFINVWVMPE